MKLATLNTAGVSGKAEIIQRCWDLYDLDILCLVETWCRPTNRIPITQAHYSLAVEAPGSRFRGQGGIALLYREDLDTKVLARHGNSAYQILAIQVNPNLTVIGVYLSPSAPRSQVQEFLDKLKSLTRGPTVIMGDWNSRHQDWDSARNCPLWGLRWAQWGSRTAANQKKWVARAD